MLAGFKKWMQLSPRPKILFVCTGNTCRSPMAEAFAKKLLPDAEISSAGFMHDDKPPTDKAVVAAQEYGVDHTSHRSRILTPEMIEDADYIFTMSDSHIKGIWEMSPDAMDKVVNLNIGDPFGRGLPTYKKTAKQIWRTVASKVVPIVKGT